MSRLPVILSLPHAGLSIPPEVDERCLLTDADLVADSDEGAAEIYGPLERHVQALLTTDVARAIVDLDRPEHDRGPDGVVKQRTCWNIPVYPEPLDGQTIETLLERHHRPFHRRLAAAAEGPWLGVDCHTMAPFGPPVGPDPGRDRPRVCVSASPDSCPPEWLSLIVTRLGIAFHCAVTLNDPLRGGFILNSRPGGIPWIQISISRTRWITFEWKTRAVLDALGAVIREMKRRGFGGRQRTKVACRDVSSRTEIA